MYRTLCFLLMLLLSLSKSYGQASNNIGEFGSAFIRYSIDDPNMDLDQVMGSNNYWDLTTLKNLSSEIFNIRHADYGSAISVIGEAELLIDNADSEYFYDIDQDNLILKGSSMIEIGPGHYHTGVAQGYFDIHRDVFTKEKHVSSSSISVELYEDDLYESGLTDLNPFDYQYFFTRHLDQNMSLTNRGTLVLPHHTYAVDQILISRDVNQYVSVKKDPFINQEIILPSDYSNSYVEREVRFYVSDYLLPVCKIFIDDENKKIKRVEFFDFKNHTSENISYKTNKDHFIIQNNPTFGKVILSIGVKSPGMYNLVVKNILGSIVHKEKIDVQNELRLPVDFSFLNKGSYFCSLVDIAGSTITSRKLVILKP